MYFICQTDHCCPGVSEYSVLPEWCLSLCGSVLCHIVTVVFNVYRGHIILSGFQPAVVFLSGFVFTYPVPSPTVTLRVKSTLLREFTQMTKVCEQERYQIIQWFSFLWVHESMLGEFACMMWCPSLLERCHPAWMVHLSVSQQLHFIVTTTFMCCCCSKSMKLTFVCLFYHAFSANIHTLVILYVLFLYCIVAQFSLNKWTCSTKVTWSQLKPNIIQS